MSVRRGVSAVVAAAALGISSLYWGAGTGWAASPSPDTAAVPQTTTTSATNLRPTSPGALIPLAPTRVLDTRLGIGVPAGAVHGGSTIQLAIAGVGGVPSSGAAAVMLNVTVTQPTSGGYITVYADGTPTPATSNVDFLAGRTVPNLVVVAVPPNGKVDLHLSATGSAHVIADAQGYYVAGSATAAGVFAAVPPARILDSRTGNGVSPGAVAGGSTTRLLVAGRGGVPAGASGAVVNVTVTGGAAAGYVTAYADGLAKPNVSNLNYSRGHTIQNLAIVGLPANGYLDLHVSSSGPVQLIVDVFGYFIGGTAKLPGTLQPSFPTRLMDTRIGYGTSPPTHVAAGTTITLAVPVGLSLGPTAIGLNVTVTDTTGAGWLTVFSHGSAVPASSNVNFARGQTVANLSVTNGDTGTREVDLHVGGTGTVDIIVDAQASFTSPYLAEAPMVASQSGNTWTASRLPVPSDAQPGGSTHLNSQACPTTTECVAVGTYDAADGIAEPLFETLSNGAWTASRGPLPPDALTTRSPGIGWAACGAPGSCIAAGSYTDTNRMDQAIVASDSNGSWSTVKAPLPSDASTTGGAVIATTTCPGTGTCLAVLIYFDTSGRRRVAVDSVTGGAWSSVALPLPADAGSIGMQISGISCPDATDCIAVGAYIDSSRQARELAEALSGGSWSVSAVPAPTGSTAQGAKLRDVSCTSATSCVSVGWSWTTTSSTMYAIVATLTGGVWTTAVAPTPSNSAQPPNSMLDSITCAQPGSCEAAGSYSTNGHLAPWADTLSGGTSGPTQLPLPPDATPSASTNPTPLSIQCSSPAACIAVVAYDAAGTLRDSLDVLDNGTWTARVPAQPADAAANTAPVLGHVSCPAPGSCLDVGGYFYTPGAQ